EVADQCGRANFSSVVSTIVGTGPQDPLPPSIPETKRTLDLFVTFANGSRSDPGTGTATVTYVPEFPDAAVAVDKAGIPLPGFTGGKCSNCDIGKEGDLIGPVIHLAVTGPVEYSMRIYGNLGDFVCEWS